MTTPLFRFRRPPRPPDDDSKILATCRACGSVVLGDLDADGVEEFPDHHCEAVHWVDDEHGGEG
jgi:hypothetical protein